MKRDGLHHRADIVGNYGTVVELQHSQISPEVIAARESFYGRMVWLFDASVFVEGLQQTHVERLSPARPRVGAGKDNGVFTLKISDQYIHCRSTLTWKRPKRTILIVTKSLFFDMGVTYIDQKRIFHVLHIGSSDTIIGRFYPVEWFIRRYLSHVALDYNTSVVAKLILEVQCARKEASRRRAEQREQKRLAEVQRQTLAEEARIRHEEIRRSAAEAARRKQEHEERLAHERKVHEEKVAREREERVVALSALRQLTNVQLVERYENPGVLTQHEVRYELLRRFRVELLDTPLREVQEIQDGIDVATRTRFTAATNLLSDLRKKCEEKTSKERNELFALERRLSALSDAERVRAGEKAVALHEKRTKRLVELREKLEDPQYDAPAYRDFRERLEAEWDTIQSTYVTDPTLAKEDTIRQFDLAKAQVLSRIEQVRPLLQVQFATPEDSIRVHLDAGTMCKKPDFNLSTEEIEALLR